MDKVKLTKRVVDNLPAAEAPYTVRDAELPGFSIRIYTNGRRAFFYRYRVGGARGTPIREPRIGDFGALTVDQARSIAKDWAAEVRRGVDPAAARSGAHDAPKMNELFDRYLRDHAAKRKKPSSLYNDIRMIEVKLKPTFGDIQVKDVTRQNIRRYHAGLEDKPYEANRRLALLSKVFSFAADELEWISRGDHPVVGIQKFKEVARRRYLSQQEIARLGQALAKAEAGELRRSITVHAVAMLRLLALTGARHSEILKLRWDEVNLERGCLELEDSKTGRKTIQLPPAARKILSELLRLNDNPYVIAGAKPGRHLVNIKDSWAAIRQEAGLEDVRIHDLRHTFASLGARSGMSLPVIGALLGHTSSQTTQRYAHLSDDPLRAAADSIGSDIAASLGVT
jgi:integrase